MAFLTGWTYRKKLSIDNTKIDSSLTDLPVLVKLDVGNFDFAKAELNGEDIRFTLSDGVTLLDFEKENYISGVEAFYWVNVPTVSAIADTDIFIYYGNVGVDDALFSTDLTVPAQAATKAFSSSEFDGNHLDNTAFDDNRDGTNNRWAGDSNGFPYWIGWDFGGGNEEKINGYEFKSRDDAFWEQIPYDWSVQGTQEKESSDLTTPAMVVIADNDNGVEVKEQAFDNNAGTFFATTNTALPHYIGIDFGVANEQIINSYTIRSRSDGSFTENPYDWTLEASNTGAFAGEEVTLDTRVNEPFTQSQKRHFDTFSGGINTTAYRFYRILATANQPAEGNTVIAVAEIEFMSGGFWTTLDTRVNEDFTRNQSRRFQFPVENTTAYRAYRFFITANQPTTASDNAAITEIQLFDGSINPADTWNSDYKAIYHLKESSTGALDEFLDSTINPHYGQGAGGIPSLVDSAIYKGQDGDGSTEYITIPDSDDFFFDGDFTIEWKAKWEASLPQTSFMGQSAGAGLVDKWIIWWNAGTAAGNQLGFDSVIGGSETAINFSWTPVADTQYHLALSREGNNWKFYVDGVQVGGTQVSAVSVPNVGQPLRLLRDGEGFRYFNGALDEVRISKGIARSAAELKGIFNSDNDTLLSFGVEELDFTLVDVNTDIRVDFPTFFEDIDTDIRVAELVEEDIDTDIRVNFPTFFEDIDNDIRVSILDLDDINTDIRVLENIFEDINSDIRVSESVLKDINTDIRVTIESLSDISTDIRVNHVIPDNFVTVQNLQFEEGYYISSTSVTILLEVTAAINMQFKKESGGAWTALEPFNVSKDFTLDAGDGLKQVFVRFQDIAGNLSSGLDVIDGVLTTVNPPAPSIEAYEDETATTPIVESSYQNDTTPFFKWIIPTHTVPYEGFSFELDALPDDSVNILTPDVILSGIVPTKGTPFPEMTIDTSSGTYYFNQDFKDYNAQSVTLVDGGAQDRIDVIYISASIGSLNIEQGTEAVTPVKPVLSSDAIEIAEVLVPAGTVLIAGTTLTDTRNFHLELDKYLNEPISSGQHTLNVKGIAVDGTIGSTDTFNIWISNPSPEMGEIEGWTDVTKVFQINNGIYQTADDTPYFEWTAAPSQPGPITYFYTTDGSEPTLASSSTTSTNLGLGPFSQGITTLKIKPFDDTTGNSGTTKEFNFVFGTETFTDDTAIISGSTTLKQSNKEIQVKKISWDFDSARLCRIFQPVLFDDNLPFSEGDTLSVIFGSTNATVFTGKVVRIERSISSDQEGVMYECVGPRGDLKEEYAFVTDIDSGDTAEILFEDTDVSSAITTITEKFPTIIKNIESFPTGANISEEFIGQTVSQVLDGIYSRTKFGWYIKPNGSLVSIDLTANDGGDAKFGVLGTTVSSISPQYNVMGANIQFDGSNRYNKVIIEGSKKRELINVSATCTSEGLSSSDTDARFKIYKINSKWSVVKIIETKVSYSRLVDYIIVNIGENVPAIITKFQIIFLETKIAKNNVITNTKRKLYATYLPNFIYTDPDSPQIGVSTSFNNITDVTVTTDTVPQGSLGPNNTIRFPQAMYTKWPAGASIDTDKIRTLPGINLINGVPSYFWKGEPKKICAKVTADVLVETIPLKVEVSVAGSASGISKTLRLVREEFKFDEDPDNLIDDTSKMTQFGNDALQQFKDIKIQGTITLDTVDLSWDLNKTVNLINTAQGGWTTLNAKVIGISYNFDTNTTTLEITSEFLG